MASTGTTAMQEGSDPLAVAPPPAWTGRRRPEPGLAEPDEAAARTDLRRQISRLESVLCAAVVAAPGTATALRPAARGGGARLMSLADLELIRDDLVARVDAVSDRARALEASHARARALLESMYADPGAHKWTRVSRDDLGLQGCGHYHVRPRLGVVGLLRGWWVVKVSSGCPLAT